ncbi:hypothetical protein JTE90_005880 [Oedothorax gibbosus]|uniref:Uncharacterized protein n=1 Tax=Oedothorax gibbosus TaxID=931172 RepID=A0AAV6UPH7_9ARAC|nr:hypothetical protein JTE90_005880 [Oedothorax gibbosus]
MLYLSQHCFKEQKRFLEEYKNSKFPSLNLPKKHQVISAKKRTFHCFCTETKNPVMRTLTIKKSKICSQQQSDGALLKTHSLV